MALARTYSDRSNAWPEWIATAPNIPFDAERFFRWRCWWEYGTGIAGDLMSHQWAWEEAVTVVMAVEAHFKERRVKWDPVNEEIV